MAHRYLFVLLDAASEMVTARRARTVVEQWGAGAGRGRSPASRLARCSARAHALSEEIHQAMLARGYRGEARTLGRCFRYAFADGALARGLPGAGATRRRRRPCAGTLSAGDGSSPLGPAACLLGTKTAQSRASFLDTVLRPVGGWGEERWVPPKRRPARRPGSLVQRSGSRSVFRSSLARQVIAGVLLWRRNGTIPSVFGRAISSWLDAENRNRAHA